MNFKRRIVFAAMAIAVLISGFPAGVFAAPASAVALRVECPDDFFVGSDACVRITVGKPDVPLQAIEFTLSYDPAFVRPVVTDNSSGGMDVFAKKIPAGWEQIHSLSASEHKYFLRFASEEPDGAAVALASQIIIEIPFTVIAPGSVSFACDSGDIVAVPKDDESKTLSGTGGSVTAVAAGETEKISVSLSGSDTAVAGRNYPLSATVTNLGDVSGVIAAEFALEYDPYSFVPAVTENDGGQMDDVIVSCPGEWEQMCSVDAANGVFNVRVAAVNLGSVSGEIIKQGESIELKFLFRTVGEEGSVASFTVRSASIIGVNTLVSAVAGRGGSISVSVEDGSVDPGQLGDYTVEDGMITGVKEKTPAAEFIKPFAGGVLRTADGKEVTGGYAATGMTLELSGGIYTVVVRGDCSGNGVIDVYDYAMAKRTVLKTYSPNAAQIKAMCVSGRGEPNAVDYAMIKRHVLGTYDINGGTSAG